MGGGYLLVKQRPIPYVAVALSRLKPGRISVLGHFRGSTSRDKKQRHSALPQNGLTNMAYEVLARKWRPQQFADVVGQDHVTQTLQNAIRDDRIAHAYLFVGPRGIGKTSIARIFARSLNCKEGASATPCGDCDSCREIAAGTSLDVLEIDGASNNGVEQVRDLRDTVKYAPAHGKYRIYIIDEVHMLSVAAFNALLKTLEEPPPHVKFFFATTEPQKILATIVSRCQRFDLRRIPIPMIVERLRLITREEKVDVGDDALLAVARGAEGSLRDAESALDQLIAFCGKKITEQDVLSIFGLVSRAVLEDLAESVLKSDMPRLIRVVADLDEAGKDFQRLLVELMQHFRNVLVCLHVSELDEDLDILEAQVEVLQRQAAMTDSAKVLRVVDVLADAEDRMKHTLSRRILMETCLIRCARAAAVATIEEILTAINALKEGVGTDATPAPPPAATKGDLFSGSGEQKAPPPAVEKRPEMLQKDGGRAAGDASSSDDLARLQEQWRDVIDKAAKISVAAGKVLVDARPVKLEGGTVTVAFDPEFAEEMKCFEVARNRKALEHALAQVLRRREVKVVIEKAQNGDGVGVGKMGATPDAKRDAAGDDTVRDAMDIFKGSVLEVRE